MANPSSVDSYGDEPLAEYRRRNGRSGGAADNVQPLPRPRRRSPSLAAANGRHPGSGPSWLHVLGWAAHQWGWPALLGALAGSARLAGGAFPLATGYVVALAALGDRSRAWTAGIASFIALIFAGDGIRWVEHGLIVMMTGLLAAALRPRPGEPQAGEAGREGRARRSEGAARALGSPLAEEGVHWALPLYVFAGTVLLRVGMLYVARAGLEAMTWATLESVLELGAAWALIPAAALHVHRPARLQGPQLGGLTLALAGLAWALGPLDAAGRLAGDVLVYTGILWAALGGGTALAAPVGAALGALTAAAGAGIENVGLCALAGLGAGIGRPWGKAGTAAGLLAGRLLVALFGLGFAEVYSGLIGAGAAGALLAVTPRSLLVRWLAWLGADRDAHDEGRERAKGRGGKDPLQAGAARDMGQYLRRLSYVFDELGVSFEEVSAVSGSRDGPGDDDDAVGLFVEGIHERLCQGCSAYRFCWEEHVQQTYRDVVEVAAVAEREGKLSLDHIPQGLRDRCIQIRSFHRTSVEIFKLVRLHHSWSRRFRESQELVPRQLRALAQLMRDMAGRVEEGDVPPWKAWPTERRPHRLTLRTAVRRRAKGGALVSGDADGQVDLGADRVGLILSDGMGVGEPAARESRAVVRLLRTYMAAGFDEQFAIKAVNAVLLLRSPEETFATIDLAVLNLGRGEAELVKVGAAPTFIVRGNRPDNRRVTVVRGTGVPAGVFQQVEAEPRRLALQPGDLVVMMTDGVLDAWTSPEDGDSEMDGAERLARWLSGLPWSGPDEVAERLLERSAAGGVRDDMTVLAALVEAPPPIIDPKDVKVYRRADEAQG